MTNRIWLIYPFLYHVKELATYWYKGKKGQMRYHFIHDKHLFSLHILKLPHAFSVYCSISWLFAHHDIRRDARNIDTSAAWGMAFWYDRKLFVSYCCNIAGPTFYNFIFVLYNFQFYIILCTMSYCAVCQQGYLLHMPIYLSFDLELLLQTIQSC